jgi:hypothetical protein
VFAIRIVREELRDRNWEKGEGVVKQKGKGSFRDGVLWGGALIIMRNPERSAK